MSPFSLEEKKMLEIPSKVTYFKCSKANKPKLRCSQNDEVDKVNTDHADHPLLQLLFHV